MTRRASLPGADELFRNTAEKKASEAGQEVTSVETRAPAEDKVDERPNLQVAPSMTQQIDKKPRHDEKVTFYCTAIDLTRLERTKLMLRADHGLASDRGRIVRAALTEILDDFEARGEDSALVRRLRKEQRRK